MVSSTIGQITVAVLRITPFHVKQNLSFSDENPTLPYDLGLRKASSLVCRKTLKEHFREYACPNSRPFLGALVLSRPQASLTLALYASGKSEVLKYEQEDRGMQV